MTPGTFADIPWNGPFYRQMGFRDVDDSVLPSMVVQLRERERAAGLDDAGHRVIMRVSLATGLRELQEETGLVAEPSALQPARGV